MLHSSVLAILAMGLSQVAWADDNGRCFNLETVGANPGDFDSSYDNGQTIFVGLGSATMNFITVINLSNGSFAVTDFDGTDGTASLSLPDPVSTGLTADGHNIPVVDHAGGILVCGFDANANRHCSPVNVGADLLAITTMINGTEQVVPLFDNRLSGYFWAFFSKDYWHKHIQLCTAPGL
jgi:hypothetical protein